MTRIPFSQVLKNASIDLRREYDRLYMMFYIQQIPDGNGNNVTIRDICAGNFLKMPFRGTCISLDDFDDFYAYHFEKDPHSFDTDYLVSFCEYSFNLIMCSYQYVKGYFYMYIEQALELYIQQINTIIESIGYFSNVREGDIYDFIPKDQAVISVSEIIDASLSYRVIEYNHHSMKGDINRKREILLALADKLESQRLKLKQINSTMESDLFFLFNNMNIRHNNTDPQGAKYVPFIASMNDKEIEQWYDETYQMCLLAFLELDHLERKDRIVQLKKDIESHRNQVV